MECYVGYASMQVCHHNSYKRNRIISFKQLYIETQRKCLQILSLIIGAFYSYYSTLLENPKLSYCNCMFKHAKSLWTHTTRRVTSKKQWYWYEISHILLLVLLFAFIFYLYLLMMGREHYTSSRHIMMTSSTKTWFTTSAMTTMAHDWPYVHLTKELRSLI